MYWGLTYCQFPEIQSFSTLQDKYKSSIIEVLENLTDVENASGIAYKIKHTKFNNTMYQELKHFVKEFSKRKRIEPIWLD